MDEPKRPTISFGPWHWREGLLAFYVVMMSFQVGCDNLFEMHGHLYQCGTKVPITGADGSAGLLHGKPTKFTTDRLGSFRFGVNAGEGATVRVTFLKEGFVPFSQVFEGQPANADDVELCMDPVTQP